MGYFVISASSSKDNDNCGFSICKADHFCYLIFVTALNYLPLISVMASSRLYFLFSVFEFDLATYLISELSVLFYSITLSSNSSSF